MKKVLEPLKAQLQNLQSSEKSALEFLQNPTGCSGCHHSRRASQTHARLLEARRLRPDSPVGMPGGGKEEKASGMRSSSVLLSTETQKTSALPGIAATQSWGEGSKTQDYASSQYIPYSLADCPVFGGNYNRQKDKCMGAHAHLRAPMPDQ